jgi:hypothetical protein
MQILTLLHLEQYAQHPHDYIRGASGISGKVEDVGERDEEGAGRGLWGYREFDMWDPDENMILLAVWRGGLDMEDRYEWRTDLVRNVGG